MACIRVLVEVKPSGDRATTLPRPRLPDDDFEASVKAAQAAFDAAEPFVVVRSSRNGGHPMDRSDSGAVPLVLIAPAWGKWARSTRSRRGRSSCTPSTTRSSRSGQPQTHPGKCLTGLGVGECPGVTI